MCKFLTRTCKYEPHERHKPVDPRGRANAKQEKPKETDTNQDTLELNL